MILMTGADGYLGWPTLLKLSAAFPEERIVGVDSLARRKWVEEVGSVSATPIESLAERVKSAAACGFSNISMLEADLTDRDTVYLLLQTYRPRAIVHLAAQPSAPYSQINGERANFTQENNNQMCRNLLWGLHELNLKTCHFIETTTTGIYGAPEMDIPEGDITLLGWNNKPERVPYPAMATSWYHMSKCQDAANMRLAHFQWGLPISELRTAIVFGADTTETKLDPRLSTRFDFDFYFGVLPNRFVAQALADCPITVYGKGYQKKPMIPLEEAATSIVQLVLQGPTEELSIYNQYTHLASPVDLANALQNVTKRKNMNVQITHMTNPRTEREEHPMKMAHERFQTCLLPQKPMSMEQCIDSMLDTLMPYKSVLKAYRDRFISASSN
jgi:nucleoside-diphosphate-sugar epimerase